MLRKGLLVAMGAAALVVPGTASTAIDPSVKRYAVETPGSGYETVRLISVGDTVPETSHPAQQYQMVGIPDGLGAHRSAGRHEDRLHEPRAHLRDAVGAGRRRAAQPRRFRVQARASTGRRRPLRRARLRPRSATRTRSSARPRRSTTRPGRSRASARARSPARTHGFDRPIYLANEEEGRRRTPSTARAAWRSRSSTTSCTRCRSSAASPGRTRSSSRTRATGR